MTKDESRASAERRELDELLVQRAVEGLDPAGADRVEELLARHPDVDPDWADLVVGEFDAARTEDVEVDGRLREAILASAPAPRPRPHAIGDAGGALGNAGGGPNPGTSELGVSDSAPSAPGRHSLTRWGGWLAAAAVGALWIAGIGGDPVTPDLPAPDWETVTSANGVIAAEWEPGGDRVGDAVSGRVAWDGTRQAGVMRFSGLAANAPDEYQYQLWIFDDARDARYPVDGGVFDVPVGAETVDIPVRPAVPVENPTMFAVTVERPGGVVVSDRRRIAALATVGEG